MAKCPRLRHYRPYLACPPATAGQPFSLRWRFPEHRRVRFMSPAPGYLLAALAALGRMAAANEIGMVTSTLDGVRDANEAFLNLTGYSRAELTAGRVHWRALTAPEWTSMDDSAVDELRTTGSYGPHLKEYRRGGNSPWTPASSGWPGPSVNCRPGTPGSRVTAC